jgi:hypothetical protein
MRGAFVVDGRFCGCVIAAALHECAHNAIEGADRVIKPNEQAADRQSNNASNLV